VISGNESELLLHDKVGAEDIIDVIKKHTGEDSDSDDKPEKSKDAHAFELFLQESLSLTDLY
jgi:hypothetical protein